MPEKFEVTDTGQAECLSLSFFANFVTADWPEVEKSCQTKIAEGIRDIVIDLRKLMMIDSRFLGQLVGMNTRLLACQGEMTLIIEPDSNIEKLLKLTRIDQIIKTQHYKPLVEKPESESDSNPKPEAHAESEPDTEEEDSESKTE